MSVAAHDCVASRGRTGPCSRFVEVGEIRWHVSSMGSGPVALLVHGAGASSHSFHALMDRLAHRFTVVAPDLPGHARSYSAPTFDPTLANIADALAELDDALGLRPRIVVGHSAGAAVAARWALGARNPPRLLVGLAPALVPLRGLARAIYRPAAALLRRSFVPSIIASRFATTGRVDQILRSTGTLLDAQGVESYRSLVARREHVDGVLSMMARWDVTALYDALPTLAIPCLLVAGADDRAAPLAQVQDAAARMRRVKLSVLHGAGHLLHEEQPDRVAREITMHADRHVQFPPSHEQR